MKCYVIITDSGPMVILTGYLSVLDPPLIEKLADKNIPKFIACEVPFELAKLRYGTHFSVVKDNVHETDDLRILDEDGEHVFKLFRFDELGPIMTYEPSRR